MEGFRNLLRRARAPRGVGVACGAAVAASLVFGLWPAGADDPVDWHYVGESGEPAFTEGAINVSVISGINYSNVAFRKVGDETQLRGVVGPDGSLPVVNGAAVLGFPGEQGATGPFLAELFVLPCENRPEHVVALTAGSGDTFGKAMYPGAILITPNGKVYGGTPVAPQWNSEGAQLQMTWSLDGMSFPADQTTPSEGCETTTTTEAPTTTEEVTTTTEEVTTTTEEVTTTTEAP